MVNVDQHASHTCCARTVHSALVPGRDERDPWSSQGNSWTELGCIVTRCYQLSNVCARVVLFLLSSLTCLLIVLSSRVRTAENLRVHPLAAMHAIFAQDKLYLTFFSGLPTALPAARQDAYQAEHTHLAASCRCTDSQACHGAPS